jgi:hypothetical protein
VDEVVDYTAYENPDPSYIVKAGDILYFSGFSLSLSLSFNPSTPFPSCFLSLKIHACSFQQLGVDSKRFHFGWSRSCNSKDFSS